MVTHWWVAEMPPIPGVLRAVFYAGLLTLCLFDSPSPLQSARIISRTEPVLYTPVGVLRAAGVHWVRPAALSRVTALTIVAWLAATVGYLQPVSAALTFLGFAFLHAVNAGALGSNHSTHAALYALFCLSFSVSPDGFSLDRFLSEHAHWPRLVPPGSVLESGFAATLLLVFLVYIMFAAGVAKLRNGGLGWLNGAALRHYIVQSARAARWPWLSRRLVERPALCRYLAWVSLAIEISAPLALWSSSARLPLILAWTCLHIGILLVMMPAYWVQMWCYLLLIDWAALWTVVTGRTHTAAAVPPPEPGAAVLASIGFLTSAALLVVLLRQSEQWPFTSVPMYSNGVPPEMERLPTTDELHRRAVRARRGRPSAWKRPWVATEAMEDIRIVPARDRASASLFPLMARQAGVKFVRWSQFAKVVRSVAIADVAAKPPHCPGFDPARPDYPATRFLRQLVPVVTNGLPDWRQYDQLQLVCNTAAGWLVIGQAGLSEAVGPTQQPARSSEPG